jgi:hypothetical protein
MEEETRSPNKWRMSRDSPEQGITFSFAGVGGKCCSIELLHRIFGLKYSTRIGRTKPGIDSASDGGHIRRRVPRA